MSENLQQLILNLKLRTIAARLKEMLAAAEQAGGTPLKTLLTQLFRAEWEARLGRAHMPELLSLESVNAAIPLPSRVSAFATIRADRQCHLSNRQIELCCAQPTRIALQIL